MKQLFNYCLILFLAVGSATAQKNITVEDIWSKGTFRAEYVYGLRSMNDGLDYTALDRTESGQNLNQYSYKTGNLVKTLVKGEDLKTPDGVTITINSYAFSKDETKLLIGTNQEAVYRHSSLSDFYIYDLSSKKSTKLTDGAKQRLAEFSPTGSMVAFVKENNLFIKNLITDTETKVTSDGKWNEVINGGTDWVYEEEFAFNQAFFWSPDGLSLAYYRFDESMVKEFNMAMYDSLYPEDYKFKYPKAGEDNSQVDIYMINIKDGKKVKASLPVYEYVPRIKWANNAQLAIITMNRHQSNLKLLLSDVNTGESKLILEENSKTYIDVTDDLTFLPEGAGFIWSSDKSGFNHLYKYNLSGGDEVRLSSGKWDVDQYLGYDEKAKTVYYSSTEVSPLERNIYTVKISGKGKKVLTPKAGFNNANFSNGFKYFINTYSNANTPQLITLNDKSGKLIRTLKSNDALKETMEEYNLSTVEFFNIPIENGDFLNAYSIKPPSFDESKKYPVLMYVYGGPGSQTVKNSWGGSNYFWFQMLAQQGYIIVSVDNRGTGARGSKFKKITYTQLGKYETEDQIAAAKVIGKSAYIDENRIGIWGWSYGGYMSSLCLFKGADVFKTAIAVAPVTNWRYYDNIYTERYMRTPQENAEGYDSNSPINHVDSLKGNYLLIHGSADDNVHYQNSMEMVDALVNANKQFDLMIYPNKNHGIYGGNTRLHLYNKMTNYLIKNL